MWPVVKNIQCGYELKRKVHLLSSGNCISFSNGTYKNTIYGSFLAKNSRKTYCANSAESDHNVLTLSRFLGDRNFSGIELRRFVDEEGNWQEG